MSTLLSAEMSDAHMEHSIFRAVDKWIRENNYTPYLVVDMFHPDVRLPSLDGEEIVLNVGSAAAHQLMLTEQGYEFDGLFDSRPFHVFVPYAAIISLYAKEIPSIRTSSRNCQVMNAIKQSLRIALEKFQPDERFKSTRVSYLRVVK